MYMYIYDVYNIGHSHKLLKVQFVTYLVRLLLVGKDDEEIFEDYYEINE